MGNRMAVWPLGSSAAMESAIAQFHSINPKDYCGDCCKTVTLKIRSNININVVLPADKRVSCP
jgi:hypothetical protein